MHHNVQTIQKLARFSLKNGVFAWIAAIFVWYLIISTLRNGISCDEGYYLMGYLQGQDIEGVGTDFHAIIRAISRSFPDDDIMVFRYLRLAFNLLAIVLFADSSFKWLSRKKGLSFSRWAFSPMILLAGAMSFTFASPTISYDSLELIIVLLAASFVFYLISSDERVIQTCCAFSTGLLFWFACSNYPPAGVCIVILLTILYFIEIENKRWSHLMAAFLGIIAALLVSHYFIHDMKEWFAEISKVFISTFTEESRSRHDAGSLVSTMLLTALKLVLVFAPLVAVLTLFYKRVHLSERVQWALIMLICVGMCVVRKAYELRSVLLLIPVALVLAKVLAKPSLDIKKFLLSKDLLLLFVLMAIPIAGVFGTNQPILKKALIYTPFWVLAFYVVSTQIRGKDCERLVLLFTIIMMAGYVWLGNFQRYHYYYTPRSSRYEIVGAIRPQKVLVSKYQQEYYYDLLDTLKTSGCKPRDKYMAFGENQMAVYLAGGYISGRLPYHWWQYKVFQKDAPQAFILFKNEEKDVIDYFQKADWMFPENYERIEMRQMSQNMSEEYRTVLYIKQASWGQMEPAN